jgi:hypothetical protein
VARNRKAADAAARHPDPGDDKTLREINNIISGKLMVRIVKQESITAE